MAAKTSAKAVANYFISKGIEEGVEITHLKLQKLVYYAFAWVAGNYHENLFDDDIEAWPHGPVVRELYVEFHDAGRAPIKRFAQEMDYDTRESYIPKVGDLELVADLEKLWNAYKKLSAIQLSNMTHAAGEPWDEIKRVKDLDLKPPIPPELIRNIYQKKVAKISESQSTAAQS